MNKLNTKVFSDHIGDLVEKPNLSEIQLNSWEFFLNRGLKSLFEEVSPISDYTGDEYKLSFLDYYFDKPKFSEEESMERRATYEASLKVRVKLTFLKEKNTSIVHEVYVGDYPIMTKRSTFIINGVERTVVSQFVRSAGVYFGLNKIRRKTCFTAKVIPDRGSWLEFESEPNGFIGVKIDKHRKIPVTDLLRVFGMEDDDILKTFRDVDTGSVEYIKMTLSKDEAKNIDDSYVEIYKRLRPGDLVSINNIKVLIDGMFKNKDRFSLSEVGRKKMNERLEIDDKVETHLLRLEDIVKIVREIIRLNNDNTSQPDDIDALSNRRVRSVGELILSRMRVGFARMRRVIQDRMSTYERENITPAQLINAKLLMSVVRNFFASSQLSQFMDQVNPLAEVEHKRRLSAMGPGALTKERAGFEVRDVHTSHYGRVCPIQSPEGGNIGLINQLASFSRTDRLGFLETPYAEVKNGKITKNIVWMTAQKERKHKIASGDTNIDKDGNIVDKLVEARYNREPGLYKKDKIDFIDVSVTQTLSIATSLIPFLEHDDGRRSLMGSNMQRQAVPLISPEIPLVGTGVEERVARDSGRVIIAEESGEITDVSSKSIELKTLKGKKIKYNLEDFKRSNQYTAINQKPIVKKGEKIKKGQILADGSSTKDGVLALGQNILVAFVPYFGGGFEDAIVMSERVAQQDRLTSVHIENFSCYVRDTKLGAEETTSDIPNISEEKLKNLDEDGIIRIGAEIKSGDILVGKISPKGEKDLTAEEKLLQSIFGEKARDVKDSSLYLPHGRSGKVIGIKILSREKGDNLSPGIIKMVQIEVAQLRKIMAGDKLSGRHGNKGVISRVYPVEDMPYLEDGTPIDIVLNPMGVATRMNLGQVLEMHLGLAANKLKYRAVTPVFTGASEKEISDEMEKAGYPADGKLNVYDGKTGKRLDKRVAVGYMYILKLNHLVEDKIHMRSIGPYSLVTQQPLGGKAHFGGQRFGEMEVWALEGYGSAYTLQEMLTIKSDDVFGRASSFEAIVKGEEIHSSSSPSAFNVLVSEMDALGLKVDAINKEDLSFDE